MQKKNKRSVREMIENKKDMKWAKRLDRSPKKGVMTPDGQVLPEGWEKMSKEALAVDAARRKKHNYYSRTKNKPGDYRVVFTFTSSELGLPSSSDLSEDDLNTIKKVNPTYAKKLKYGKIKGDIAQEVILTRNPEMSFKKQWAKDRDNVKTHLIQKYQAEMEEAKNKAETAYNPDLATALVPSTEISLDNLTTTGDLNDRTE